MSFWIKLPLAPALLAALASPGISACASAASPAPATVYSGDDSGASPPANGDDSGSPGTTGDSGGVSNGGDSGSATCTLPAAWVNDAPACNTCQQKSCCASILACAADKGCTAIFTCQSNCYSGVGLDGGAITGTPIDDAGDSAEDLCAATCLSVGTPAAQALFNPQDTCVNTTCLSTCD
jgi:hypothetical protein